MSNYEFLNTDDRDQHFLNHHFVHSDDHEGSKYSERKINDFMSHETIFGYVIFI